MIRDLRDDDASEVAAMDTELFGDRAWGAEAWRAAAVPDPDRCFLVLADADGRLIGYGGVLRAGSDADILTVGIAPWARRRGHGRQLLQSLLEAARRWRCLAVFLEVAEGNDAAASLYRDAGFEAIGTRRHYYGPDRHAVVMRKQLREPLGSLPLQGEDR